MKSASSAPMVRRHLRRASIGIALAGGLLLSACAPSNAASEEEIVLDFPSWQANEPGNSDVFKAIIAEFESRHPGVTVNLYHVANEDFVSTILTQLQAGDPPDIIPSGSSQYFPFVETGLIEPLTDRLEESGLLDTWTSSQDDRLVDGDYYALTLHGLIRLLHYNEAYLAEAGVEVPSTPEELRAAVEAVEAAGLSDVSGWGATTTTHPNLTGELTAFVLGMGKSWITDGEWTVDDPGTAEAVQLYRDLASQAPPGLNGGQYRQLMADGKIAMSHDGNWVVSFFDEASPADVRPQLQVAPSPFEHAVMLMGTGLSMPKDISDERKDLVWEFIQVAAEEEFQALWAEYLNAAPGRLDSIPDALIAERPELAVIQANIDKSISEWPDSVNFRKNFGEIDIAFQDAVMRMLTGDEPTSEILTELEAQLASITEP